MILDAFRLDGKVAVVTGGGRGLGLGFSLALAQAGADVVIVDRTGSPEAVEAIEALGRRAWAIQADLLAATPEQVRELVEEIARTAGRIDVLVNNAGIIRREPAIDFTSENWAEVIDLNLSKVFYLSQAVARVMAARGEGGKIINIASMLSFQGGKIVPSYTASKSGIAGLTRALASEWSGLGINVNAIAPGYFATDNTAQLRADDTRSAEILARIPAGRWGTPADLQGAAVFLASPASDYVHGSILPVDGGWLTR
ncbi:2-deoxy-D-gluconate 3-dehydrogenase [Salana multivorans]|uniref:2-deoxy-D-gluconate 3-dehydrogenase n=2 Tax=Salana multivorans TaxID=120377 RepID=A0A3N2D9U4_9MICO|nr:2-deoxy-D-gluconate 3-dehydrogenase [Salana multivorans]